jgi:methionine-rich copper-binding protein CopC
MSIFHRPLPIAAVAIVMALALAAPASAHTSLRRSNIADGAILAENPRVFTMEFGADSGLAAVTLTDAAGRAIPLNFTPTRSIAKTFSVPLPALSPGAYRLAWRIVGGDGHVMNGAVNFRVGESAPAASAPHQASGGGHGHGAATESMLASSTPADGATLATAPRTLSLRFVHPVTLQTVAIANAAGAPVRASFRRPTVPTTGYSIALSPLSSGVYTAKWTATGDGHAMQGALTFTVR